MAVRLDHDSYLGELPRTRSRTPTLPSSLLPVSGGESGGETPVPIPNTAVKPSSADGTARSPCGRVGRRRIYSKQGPGSPGVGGRALCVLASRARLERGRAAR